MTPQPIGAGAYGLPPTQAEPSRRVDLTKYHQDITQALNADEAVAISESFGTKAATPAVQGTAESRPVLGRHIDIRA